MKTENNKYILDIVPLTRIPLTRGQSFSYLHEAELSIGTLVVVPLFRRKVEGIVIGSKKDFPRSGGIELKKIEKVLEENFLTQKQIELSKFISEYYISPLGIVMKSFVPKRVKARNLKLVSSNLDGKTSKKILLTKEQRLAVGTITNYKLPPTNYLLYGHSGSGKTEVYIHSILEYRKKDKNLQFLILLPEKTLTPQAIERYGQYFSAEETVVISSSISAGLLYSSWKKIQSGEAKIIIATRKGAFSPFNKLGLIIIDEEQDMSHKQWDMNPRYDARTLAEELGRNFSCPIVRGSATPSVETYYLAKKNKYGLLILPYLRFGSKITNEVLDVKCKMPNVEIVDMRRERWQKNYSCISKKLKSEIEYALRNKQQSILFINRQGMSSFSVCESCKSVLKCPKCDRALIYDNMGEYRCVHCKHKTSITPKCEKCKGIIFKNVGMGTQKVEREIQNLFPGVRVSRIDSQAIKEKGYQEKTYKNFSGGKTDILIGTQMVTKGWDLPSVSLIGIIDTDSMLSIPDFRANERFFQNIVQISGRTSRPGAKFSGMVILQTFQPENRLIKAVIERDFERFYEKEFTDRKALGFPPFSGLIKLVFQDFSLKKTFSETQKAYNFLSKIRDAKINEPQDPLLPKIRGRWRKQIIARFSGKMPSSLRVELKKLGPGWTIDVDPISIS